MATVTTHKSRSSVRKAPPKPRPISGNKKKAANTVVRKKRTLLIPDLPDASVVAIDRAKVEFGVGHTTRAAQRMMESYWQKSDDLRDARDRVRQLEIQLERIAGYYEEISSAKKGIKDILAKH